MSLNKRAGPQKRFGEMMGSFSLLQHNVAGQEPNHPKR